MQTASRHATIRRCRCSPKRSAGVWTSFPCSCRSPRRPALRGRAPTMRAPALPSLPSLSSFRPNYIIISRYCQRYTDKCTLVVSSRGRKMINTDLSGRRNFQKPSPLGKVARVAGRKRSPYDAPRASVIIGVVSATRTSSVFPGTMQAFSGKSTFPRGEGYFWSRRHLPDKSEFIATE